MIFLKINLLVGFAFSAFCQTFVQAHNTDAPTEWWCRDIADFVAVQKNGQKIDCDILRNKTSVKKRRRICEEQNSFDGEKFATKFWCSKTCEYLCSGDKKSPTRSPRKSPTRSPRKSPTRSPTIKPGPNSVVVEFFKLDSDIVSLPFGKIVLSDKKGNRKRLSIRNQITFFGFQRDSSVGFAIFDGTCAKLVRRDRRNTLPNLLFTKDGPDPAERIAQGLTVEDLRGKPLVIIRGNNQRFGCGSFV